MMGLSAMVNWAGWFVRAFLLYLLSIIVNTCILMFGEIIMYSSATLVAVFFLLYLVCAPCVLCVCVLVGLFVGLVCISFSLSLVSRVHGHDL